MRPAHDRRPHRLTPEEDSIGDPEDEDDDLDDLLPADLWFKAAGVAATRLRARRRGIVYSRPV